MLAFLGGTALSTSDNTTKLDLVEANRIVSSDILDLKLQNPEMLVTQIARQHQIPVNIINAYLEQLITDGLLPNNN